NGFDLAVRIDGDGQHDPQQLGAILEPVLASQADIAVGSRFTGATGYRSSRSRRIGIRVLAWTVSALVRQRVTDTTSGFQAVNQSEEHTSELQSPYDLVCRLPLEKKKRKRHRTLNHQT